MHIKIILTREKILNILAIGVMITLFCLAALQVIDPLYAFAGVLLWMTAVLGRIEIFLHVHTIEYDVLHTDYGGGVWRFWIGGNAVNLFPGLGLVTPFALSNIISMVALDLVPTGFPIWLPLTMTGLFTIAFIMIAINQFNRKAF